MTKKEVRGFTHWWLQRMSGLLLLPLLTWLMSGVMPRLISQPLDQVLSWFSSPLVSVGGLLITINFFFHGLLGIQVILMDYLPSETYPFWMKVASTLSYGGALSGCFALFKMVMT